MAGIMDEKNHYGRDDVPGRLHHPLLEPQALRVYTTASVNA